MRSMTVKEFINHLTEASSPDDVMEFNDEDADVRFLPNGFGKNPDGKFVVNLWPKDKSTN